MSQPREDSATSSPSCSRPTLVVEIRASARLLRAWTVWIGCLALAILAGTALPWWLRTLAASALWPVLLSGRRSLGAGAPPGRLAIRGDGQWLWQPAGAAIRYVRLAGAPQHLGPFWWLPLQWGSATDWLLVDAGSMEPAGFSALQCSVQLSNHNTGTEFGDARYANC